MNKKIKVYCGFPSVGTTVTSQWGAMRQIEKEYGDRIEFVYPEKTVYRIFHDFARNEIVKEFLATDCDVLFMLDSDIVPPSRIMTLITEHYDQWQISGAAYPIWMSDQIMFTVYGKPDHRDDTLELIDMPRTSTPQTAYVDGLATGCLLIKREIFDHVEMPYFEFKYDKDRKMTVGEDLGFALKLAKKGIKFFTDYSLVCKHYKNVDLLDVSNYTVDYSNHNVKEYDKNIKEKVMALVEQNRQLKELLQKTQDTRRKPSGLYIP